MDAKREPDLSVTFIGVSVCLLFLHVWYRGRRKIKVPIPEKSNLSKVLSFRPGVGHNRAFHASPAASLYKFLPSLFIEIYFSESFSKMKRRLS